MGFPDTLATKRDEIIKKFDADIDVALEIRERRSLLEQVRDLHVESRNAVAHDSRRNRSAARSGRASRCHHVDRHDRRASARTGSSPEPM